ncbi:MAG: LLM class F420-dependent oxidoreductase [Deltaproteobacteria bacterium]|nr:LLM class F420-dependent oxidoreductase [Deltaproteobacteria bacterium]MBI3391137.1 LLM class F420-dependent oxidoreductase [Deltaproteobacteria bacterium]
MDIGRVGIWTFLDLHPTAKAQEAAAEIEALGYGAIWIPEALGREAFTSSALLLAGTQRIVIATGIANIWARDPMAMAGAQKTLTEAYPDRFLLGIGVSHGPLVGMRGHNYDKPLSAMRGYLDAMDSAPFMAATPSTPPVRVLAALAPKMLKLAAERANGSHPYFVPPEHTAHARETMGKGPLLAPEQAVVLETDPIKARDIARTHMATYLGLPNYVNNLKRLGFSDDDIAKGGSDRLVDAIVVWGTVEAVAKRVRAHHDAGADHVCLQVLDADPRAIPVRQWRELAAALLR